MTQEEQNQKTFIAIKQLHVTYDQNHNKYFVAVEIAELIQHEFLFCKIYKDIAPKQIYETDVLLTVNETIPLLISSPDPIIQSFGVRLSRTH